MLMAGAAAKGGVFFLGLWLPQAHGQAPTAISALLSGLVVKMGVVTMLRLTDAFQIGWPLLAMGVATGVFGLIYAMWERDLKVFLAYSTMSQLGYVLIGLGLGGGARTVAIGYAVGHGVFKALLFLAAGRGVDTAGRRRLPELTGRLHRSTTVALGWGMWAIVGLPPLSGFALKEGLGAASPAWAQGCWWG
ncbi:MAG: proton-conducting transporter membrane subunit [Candidatus Bipolaricaulaceae bacterium]